MPDGRTGAFSSSAWHASVIARVHRWSGGFRHDVHEATGFGDTTNAKVKEHGGYDFQGTCEGNLPASAQIFGTDNFVTTTAMYSFTLQSETGSTITFEGLFSSFEVSSQKVGGLNTFSASYESSGVVHATP